MSASGRILVGAYWIFVVLMMATFTANLSAFLTVERVQVHFYFYQILFKLILKILYFSYKFPI